MYDSDMERHTFQDYTEDSTTELAYHLHYDHGMPIADAWQHVYNGTAIHTHRMIHA